MRIGVGGDENWTVWKLKVLGKQTARFSLAHPDYTWTLAAAESQGSTDAGLGVVLEDPADNLVLVPAVSGRPRPAGDPEAAGLCVAPRYPCPEGVSWRSDPSSGHMGL